MPERGAFGKQNVGWRQGVREGFQWLEKRFGSFPMIGKKFSNGWKNRREFSNGWKNFPSVFQ